MILVTGGAGYIGSHTCVELIQNGFDVVVFDNLSNSSTESLNRVEQITNYDIPFVQGDIRNSQDIRSVFEQYPITAVMHLAGLKSVGESVTDPLRYYDNNVSGSVTLLEVMTEFGCKTLVFSSSATVYGDPESVPIDENFSLCATNPYGRSKLMVEEVLRDLYGSNPEWSIALLRYFNPVGAHESGLIGEDPNGTPNNLMPFVSQVAVGLREKLSVFGGDYDTHDGTGVRDYIHVVDLAKGHLKALNAIEKQPGLITVNLGTGHGYSVLEIIDAFEKVSGRTVQYEIVDRRSGDVAQCYADPSYALEKLEWRAVSTLEKMCEDTWRWQSKNPKGYKSDD